MSYLDYTKGNTPGDSEERLRRGLCPKKEYPRGAFVISKEWELIMETCKGNRVDAQDMCDRLGIVPSGDDHSLITSRLANKIRETVLDYAHSFDDAEIPPELPALMSICDYVKNGLKLILDTTHLSEDDIQIIALLDRVFGEYIENAIRDPLFFVHSATVFSDLPVQKIREICELAASTTDIEVFTKAFRYIRYFFGMSPAHITSTFDWLCEFFDTPDGPKDLDKLQSMVIAMKTQKLFKPYPNIARFLNNLVNTIGKAYAFEMHKGLSMASEFPHTNPDMIRRLLAVIIADFNRYLREACRPPLKGSRILENMTAEIRKIQNIESFYPPFKTTMMYYRREYEELVGWIESRKARSEPALVVEDTEDESDDNESDDNESDDDEPDDDYVPFEVDTRVGFFDGQDKFCSGVVKEVVSHGRRVTGYLILDDAKKKLVEAPRAKVTKDAKGKGKATRVSEGSSGAGSSGAGSSGAGSSGHLKVGDLVYYTKECGKKKRKVTANVTRINVDCYYVLVSAGERSEDRYGYFPATGNASQWRALIPNFSVVQCNGRNKTFQKMAICCEITHSNKKSGNAVVEHVPYDELTLV